MSYKVMMSYSWRNSAERAALVGHLGSIEGVEILYDRKDIGVGSEVHKGIASMLEQANCLVALLTVEALASKEVLDEITRAHDRGITILPIVAEDLGPPVLPWFLRDLNFIPYRPADFDSVLSRIEIAIRNLSKAQGNLRKAPEGDEKEKEFVLGLFDKLIHGGENFLKKMIEDVVRIQRSDLDSSRKVRRLRIYIETELEELRTSSEASATEKSDQLTGLGMALINRSVKLKKQALTAALKVLDLRRDEPNVDDLFDEVKDTIYFFLAEEQQGFLKDESSGDAGPTPK